MTLPVIEPSSLSADRNRALLHFQSVVGSRFELGIELERVGSTKLTCLDVLVFPGIARSRVRFRGVKALVWIRPTQANPWLNFRQSCLM